MADNLKKSGAFLPGIRPGDQTASYIDDIMTRLTAAGAVYITAVCLLPEFLILKLNVPFYFGGTSLLIIVVVVMDFMAQVQSHLMSHQYEGLMKKANLKTNGGRGKWEMKVQASVKKFAEIVELLNGKVSLGLFVRTQGTNNDKVKT